MAYLRRFIRLTLLFSVGGSDEEAQTGLHLGDDGSGDPTAAIADADPADVQDLADNYEAHLMGATGLYWGDYSTLWGVKLAPIGTDGLYLGDPRVFELGTPHTGGTTPVPIQCSRLITTRSGSSVGTANVGRMYLPHTSGPTISNQPYLTTTTTNSLASASATWHGDVQVFGSTLDTGWGWVLTSSKGSGAQKEIAQIGTDNVIDTQRRRYDKLTVTRVLETL